MEKHGQTLYFASEELRNDEEVVTLAVSNKGIILKYDGTRQLVQKSEELM